jgi:hypothetical protein
VTDTGFDPAVVRAERDERDRFLSEHFASPIPEDQREQFGGADYYEPAARFVVTGTFRRSLDSIAVRSSTGATSHYRSVGVIAVTIEGRSYELTVLDDGDGGAFLAFGDATNGDTTYGGGRYLRVDIADGAEVTIDFNRATNPYCAYDEEYSCPLPPPGNSIASAIEAGERMNRASAG